MQLRLALSCQLHVLKDIDGSFTHVITITFIFNHSTIFAYRGGNPQQFLAVQISERCPDFHFISNRKSEQVVQKYVFTFSFFSKRKSSRPDFRKGVHIFVFDENQNLNTFSVQIWTGQVFRFQFSTKTQM